MLVAKNFVKTNIFSYLSASFFCENSKEIFAYFFGIMRKRTFSLQPCSQVIHCMVKGNYIPLNALLEMLNTLLLAMALYNVLTGVGETKTHFDILTANSDQPTILCVTSKNYGPALDSYIIFTLNYYICNCILFYCSSICSYSSL